MGSIILCIRSSSAGTVFIAIYIEDLYSNGCLPELRNPQESLDFIHSVYDVSTALKLVLDKSSSSGVINIGNGKVVSVSSIADYIYKLYLGERKKIQDTKYEIQNEVRFWADISDLQKEFRWKPNSISKMV